MHKLLNEIVSRITALISAKRVILFGSAGLGKMSRDSDIDLLVLQTARGNVRAASVQLRKTLRGLGYPIDVIVMPLERFEETKDVIGSIAYPANKYGKVIYPADLPEISPDEAGRAVELARRVRDAIILALKA